MKTSILLGKYKITADAQRISQIGSDFILYGSKINLELPFESDAFFSHGWQSWSLAAWVEEGQNVSPSFPISLRAMQVDPLYVNEKKRNGSWLGAIKTQDGSVLLLGALGLDSHVFYEGRKFSGFYERGEGDWFIAIGSEQEVFYRYTTFLGDRFGKTKSKKTPRIWCSWYSLYKEINEKNLDRILNELENLPFDVFQIDDGWQRKIGDWEANEKFSSGMQNIANIIKSTGKKAGLWLAPLLIVPSSTTFQNHPDWLLHDENGKLVQAGVNWSENLFSLDTTHPDVINWLSELMQRVRMWGYEYVKLDFLYAGALPGKRHKDIPREAAYRQGLEIIRTALGDAYLLTCGAPILPSLGLCDALRVGPDVSNAWNLYLESRIMNNYAVPGVQNAIRTTLNRLWLKPIVDTDPDIVYFHSYKNSLTHQQKDLLKNLAEISEFKATSDLPAWLSNDERNELRTFLTSNPSIKNTGQHSYLINGINVDYSEFIKFPKKLTWYEKVIQYLLNNIADIPFTLNILEKISSTRNRKTLKSYQ